MKRWIYPETKESTSRDLQKKLKVHPIICDLLVQRGITSFDDAYRFFRPKLSDLYDPMLIKDMDKAVSRIAHAFRESEKVMLFGDYDVDGTTAVAVVYKFLKPLFAEILYYIPHRYREGYGLSKEGIDHAVKNGCKVIIALDCGIRAIRLARYAAEQGIDLIICDHHLPSSELPDAYAILNPKQPGCKYPFKELSGCGIGFKLVQALRDQLMWDHMEIESLLDLVSISIASDIVPIVDENRILTYFGLKVLNKNPSPGIKAIMIKAGVQEIRSVSDIVFVIGPRINAVGRMDDANEAVKLLISENVTSCESDADWMNTKNEERKKLDKETTIAALDMIARDQHFHAKRSTIVFDPGWHKGVVGIVASRLIEHHHRPTIVLTESNGVITGSARSVKGFNITEALTDCNDLLCGFGGHEFAAGLSLTHQNLSNFTSRFDEICRERLSDEMLTPYLRIDAVLDFRTIDWKFYNIIKQFAPFGPSNRRPVFVSCNVNALQGTRVVKDDHLKLCMKQYHQAKNGIAFNMAKHYPDVINRPFDICYSIEENKWNGSSTIQLNLKDIKL